MSADPSRPGSCLNLWLVRDDGSARSPERVAAKVHYRVLWGSGTAHQNCPGWQWRGWAKTARLATDMEAELAEAGKVRELRAYLRGEVAGTPLPPPERLAWTGDEAPGYRLVTRPHGTVVAERLVDGTWCLVAGGDTAARVKAAVERVRRREALDGRVVGRLP